MKTRRRLLLVLVALLIPGGVLGFWLHGSATSALSFGGAELPARLGGYTTLREETLGRELLQVIQPERYVMRVYGDESSGGRVAVYASFHRGRTVQGAHDPAVCYPAQGWEVAEERQIELIMHDGETLRASLFRAFKGGRLELVLYWFQPVGRWPDSPLPEVFRRVLDSVGGQPQYAFIRLSTPELGEAGEERRILDFARLIAPALRRALESAPAFDLGS